MKNLPDKIKQLPDKLCASVFEPMYCWYENGRYTHFWPSRMQVGMCHDFNSNDPRIIEVDVRVATCPEDTQYFGILEDDGRIRHIYDHPIYLSVCGDRSQYVPVNITDMRTLQHKRLPEPRLKIEEAATWTNL